MRPGLDDKILIGWNALKNTALSKAFAATGNIRYKELAVLNMDFLLDNFAVKSSNAFYHTWKNNSAKYPAFLDDYAYLIQALIALQEVTSDTKYLVKAKKITEYVCENFDESTTGFFFYTGKEQTDVIVRKKEVFDGAQPSGNAVMLENLYRMALYFDVQQWARRAMETTQHLGQAIISYPTSFGVWANLVQEFTIGTNELVILGKKADVLLPDLLKEYIPYKIVMCSEKESRDFPLLRDKKMGQLTLIYLCRNYVCKKPVSGVKEVLDMIRAK